MSASQEFLQCRQIIIQDVRKIKSVILKLILTVTGTRVQIPDGTGHRIKVLVDNVLTPFRGVALLVVPL